VDTASKTGCDASRPAKSLTVAGRSLQLLHGIPAKAS
jgi:hypothetical protein